jgi:predicted acylesterase/phospholipase RssA
MNRAQFVALGAALHAALGPIPVAAQTPVRGQSRQALRRALVLSGGGALGAYEAGVVQTLAARGGIGEGQPLAPYELVCGTSIGALNAYLVATAQYEKLRNLWSSIASQNVIRLKPKFQKITEETAGVGTRIVGAIGLALGMFKDVKGVLDGEHLRDWLVDYFDLTRPVVMPMVWAVTNLTLETPEYYYLLPEWVTPEKEALAVESIHLAVGLHVPVLRASRDLLVDQLRASAAVPLAFDPVMLPGPHGKPAAYVDGGVTANTPVGAARALAATVDAVVLDPAFTGATYNNIVEISTGAFETTQRRLMLDTLRMAYLETFVLRALRQLPESFTLDIARMTGIEASQIKIFEEALLDVNLNVLRPKKTLPAKLLGFDDSKAIAETYAIGEADGASGFVPFDPAMAALPQIAAR